MKVEFLEHARLIDVDDDFRIVGGSRRLVRAAKVAQPGGEGEDKGEIMEDLLLLGKTSLERENLFDQGDGLVVRIDAHVRDGGGDLVGEEVRDRGDIRHIRASVRSGIGTQRQRQCQRNHQPSLHVVCPSEAVRSVSGKAAPFSAAKTLSACTVSRTSWTRTTLAP